jgi:iron complex transport system ATP-binding protein
MSAILEARSVSMTIGGATLVDGIDLSINGGEMVAIVGPNGAGKSTLLRLLSGDLRAVSGEVRLKQRDLHTYSSRQLALHRAMLSQHVNVTFPFTVEEIVHMGAGDQGRAAAEPLVEAALHEAGLSDFRHRKLPTLSGGEQQRAHFARVLVQLGCGEAVHGPACCYWTSRPPALICGIRSTWWRPQGGARPTGRRLLRSCTISISRYALPTASWCYTEAARLPTTSRQKP